MINLFRAGGPKGPSAFFGFVPTEDVLMSVELLKEHETEGVNLAAPTVLAGDRQLLIDGLNSDLAGEYQAILMYIYYSAKLTGPFRRELRSLFQAEVKDEQNHAQFLADKIVAMGGEPTTVARPVLLVNHTKQMLDSARGAEKQAIADYTIRIGQAEACGEIGLKVQLENQLADETRHMEELERILVGWDELNPDKPQTENRWEDDGGPSK